METLAELYAKPIDRPINPAVVVSNNKQETVNAEIDEYIFTNDLIENLYTILHTVSTKKSGKTGIWISGYYGSGKSHFIKFIHYCLNPNTSNTAFDKLLKAVANYDPTKAGNNESITTSNLALLRKQIQNAQFDNIMFNVEDETDDGKGERLTRIFLNMFNKFRGYNPNDIPLALLLEKPLDKKGKLDTFKQLVAQEMGHDWNTNAAQIASFELENILQLAQTLAPELDIVALHNKLTHPDSFKVGINATLIPELKEFLTTKSPNYRLLFLVDEVSQYIGTNKEILLNFQNIIERVSEDCNNQVWIACTAQQTIEDVSKSTNILSSVEDEFGKILGRFDTRISLQSNDSAYITQKRVLDKNSNGTRILSQLYEQKIEYIQNQFKLNHDLYKGYQNEDSFVLSYPFVPYQFKLISDVFEAFQQLQFVVKQIKDNERSILSITHFTGKLCANQKVGYFVPFDAFFNQQMQTNLTHRGSKSLENALNLSYVKNTPFAQRVVKTLFMVSNLLESQRLTFPSNIDNLTVLMMDKLDQNKLELQKNVNDVLSKLKEQNIVREENQSYFFFNEDEINVQHLIKNQIVNFDTRIGYFDELLRGTTDKNKISNITPRVKFGENDFRMIYSVEGKEFFKSGDFALLVLLTDTTPFKQKALAVNQTDLVMGINEWFTTDKELQKDFEWYCKTKEFLKTQGHGTTGERTQTIEKIGHRNNKLETQIKETISKRIPETRFISQNIVVETNQIPANNSADKIKNAIDLHLSRVYKNHKLAENYAQNQTDLKKSAAATGIQTDSFNSLTPAEQVVNDFISQHNHRVSAHDTIEKFAQAPFGWRHEATIDILTQLVKKKQREFMYRNQTRYPIIEFVNKALNTAERPVCEIVAGEEIDQATLDQVANSFKTIFNQKLPDTTDGNELFDILLSKLNAHAQNTNQLNQKYYGYPFAIYFNELNQLLINWINTRDPKQLFTLINQQPTQHQELVDKTKALADFAQQNIKDYDTIKQFYDNNLANFKVLSIADQEKADRINHFFKLDDPRRDYRHIRIAYTELKNALQEYTQTLIDDTVKLYLQIFEELEQEATNRNVPHTSIYANKDRTIQQIRTITAITELKNKQLSAANFKTKQLETILRYAAQNTPTNTNTQTTGEPEIYYLTKVKSTIANPTELEQYLNKIKTDMTLILNQNKIIIIK